MTRKNERAKILVADDDATIRRNLSLLLRSEKYEVFEAKDGIEAHHSLENDRFDAALLDIRMPGMDGLELLRKFGDRLEETPFIVITAYGGSSAAIEAMKLGAYDYVTKPFDLDEVLFTVRRALKQQSLVVQVESLSVDTLEDDTKEHELIGRSSGMVAVFKTVGRVATTNEPVLILGESGTGKEVVANAIHHHSDRAAGPFVKVNCAALAPSLLESELFGHEKGAFTGAIARRRGRFEQATDGTLFLDEVGELDIDLQAKLLRVLQTGRFERLGGEETLSGNARVVAATNRDLRSAIAAGRFREDLYYRLNVVSVELPPLRERKEDIPALAEYILRRLSQKYHWPHLAISNEAQEKLIANRWAGNVRELQNSLARAALLARGKVIQSSDLIEIISPSSQTLPTDFLETEEPMPLKVLLARTEKEAIRRALEATKWNRTQASRQLGISRRQLFDKIRLYSLEEP
jgi:DNA-binding NtrC family response regulator